MARGRATARSPVSYPVAATYQDAMIRSNEYYAEAGSVRVEELDMLEMASLELLASKLRVDVTSQMHCCNMRCCQDYPGNDRTLSRALAVTTHDQALHASAVLHARA